jgi:hypothetical protein
MAYDLTADKVTLAPVEFKKIQQTVTQVVDNLKLVENGHNQLVDDIQIDLNDLQTQVDGITSLTSEELDAIDSKIKTLNELVGTDDTEDNYLDIIDILNSLVDQVNASRNTVVSQFKFNAEGILDIDLTAFNLTDESDYQIMVTLNGGVFAPVLLSVEKVSNAAAKVYARDLRYFAELNEPYVDAAISETDSDGNETFPNAFDITILVSYLNTSLIQKIGRTSTEN